VITNEAVSAIGKGVLIALARSPPIKIKRNPVALDRSSRKVTSHSCCRLRDKDDNGVSKKDMDFKGILLSFFIFGKMASSTFSA
jgi:hypothetical protein